jgi:hypothetical protein
MTRVTTKCGSTMFGTSASYSACPRFKSMPRHCYPGWGFSWYSSVPPRKCRDSKLNQAIDHFLPHPFQFIIHESSYNLTLYNLSYWNYHQITKNKQTWVAKLLDKYVLKLLLNCN